jgi:hypothetical protein
MSTSQRPESALVDLLVDKWTPANVHGFDVSAGPQADAYLPLATTIDNVRAPYPSLVVSFSNETTAGESTYDFLTPAGAGQSRTGTALATVRAEDRPPEGYDTPSGDRVRAEQLVDDIAEEALRIALATPTGAGTPFTSVGGQPGPDVPDDTGQEPPVRIAQRELRFARLNEP